MTTQPENNHAAYAEAAKLFEAGTFTLPLEKAFSLELAGDAHAASAAGHVQGRFSITG